MRRHVADATRHYPQPPVLPVTGVTWIGARGVWKAGIIDQGVARFLGCYPTHAAAVAARKAAELRTEGQGQRGRAQRRYPAPPGMRACCNPDCTGGRDRNGNPTRYVGPEASFYRAGKHRQSECPACQKVRSHERGARNYRRNPDSYAERSTRCWRKKRDKARQERAEMEKAALAALHRLKRSGWTNVRIAAAVGVRPQAVSDWHRGARRPKPARINALIRLSIAEGVAP